MDVLESDTVAGVLQGYLVVVLQNQEKTGLEEILTDI